VIQSTGRQPNGKSDARIALPVSRSVIQIVVIAIAIIWGIVTVIVVVAGAVVAAVALVDDYLSEAGMVSVPFVVTALYVIE